MNKVYCFARTNSFVIKTIFFVLTIFMSCNKDNHVQVVDISNPFGEIYRAQNWFNKNYQQMNVDSNFQNTDFFWSHATIFKFNGSNNYAIVVPVFEKDQNLLYRGRRLMYLYPWKNGKGYYSVIYEIIPEDSHLRNNSGKINLNKFSGIISAWDLSKGFVNGNYFKEGEMLNEVKISKIDNKEFNSTKSNENKIRSLQNLIPVTVVGVRPAPNGWYNIYLSAIGNYSTDRLIPSLMLPNPCEYTDCSFSPNPSHYFSEDELNRIYDELMNKKWNAERVFDETNNPCIREVIENLAQINKCIPDLIKRIFGGDARFSMKITNNLVPKISTDTFPAGASTSYDSNTGLMNININNFYNKATNLSVAASLIHESMHAQILSWYNETLAFPNDPSNQQQREQIASEFGYIFGKEILSLDATLAAIVSGGRAAHHQAIVEKYISSIASTLYDFALNANLGGISYDYCRDLAWAGTFDSQAFNDLPEDDKRRIIRIVNAEKDPSGYKGLNRGAAGLDPVAHSGRQCQ